MMNTPNMRMNTIRYKGLSVGVWVSITMAFVYMAVNYAYVSSGADFSLVQPMGEFFNRFLPTNSQAINYLESIHNTSRAQIVANSYGFAWVSFAASVTVTIIFFVFFFRYFSLANTDVFSDSNLFAGDGYRNISTIFFAVAALCMWQAGFTGICFKACTYHENQVHINDADFYSVALKLAFSVFAIGGAISHVCVLLGHYRAKSK